MNIYISIAASLFIMLGIAHSYLGERFILIPLFKWGSLPKIFNSEVLTGRTIRFAWHLLTIAWFALAAILLTLDMSSPFMAISKIILITSSASCIITLIETRGRHFAWVVFLVISLLIWIGT